ncbi:hypothetical protein L2E82_50370 [Cichorium intybus]|nr:hypothetical protein L2E82_50370 [Cichorium intybus]
MLSAMLSSKIHIDKEAEPMLVVSSLVRWLIGGNTKTAAEVHSLDQSSPNLATPVVPAGSSGMANYMGQIAMAMGKLDSLENFLRQEDHLRENMLQQMRMILRTRCALGTLWLARPQE